jgi:cytochrome c oxidase subunit 2
MFRARHLAVIISLVVPLISPGHFADDVAASAERNIVVTARRYAFTPARIEVDQGDIVIITLVAVDIPHSFAVDEHRISKRATPGHSTTFELCAHEAGTFAFYCDLRADEGCRQMRGELVVRPVTQAAR